MPMSKASTSKRLPQRCQTDWLYSYRALHYIWLYSHPRQPPYVLRVFDENLCQFHQSTPHKNLIGGSPIYPVPTLTLLNGWGSAKLLTVHCVMYVSCCCFLLLLLGLLLKLEETLWRKAWDCPMKYIHRLLFCYHISFSLLYSFLVFLSGRHVAEQPRVEQLVVINGILEVCVGVLSPRYSVIVHQVWKLS